MTGCALKLEEWSDDIMGTFADVTSHVFSAGFTVVHLVQVH